MAPLENLGTDVAGRLTHGVPLSDGHESSTASDTRAVFLMNQILVVDGLFSLKDHEASMYEAIPSTDPLNVGTAGQVYREPAFVTKDSGQRQEMGGGMVRDVADGKTDWSLIFDGPLAKRWAELMTRGAVKYDARNWMLGLRAAGLPRDKIKARFRESALRHMMQWLEGDRTEDHAAAVLFNLNGYEAMLETDG